LFFKQLAEKIKNSLVFQEIVNNRRASEAVAAMSAKHVDFKRCLAPLLIAVLLLAGCGGQQDDTEERSLFPCE